MSEPQQQIAEYLNHMLISAMAAQALRVTRYWEPKALAIMDQAAIEAWGLIRASVDAPDLNPIEVRKSLAGVVVRLSDAFKDLLQRMVIQETAFAAQMLTMHGTFGPMPEIRPDSPAPGSPNERVDAADAVDQALSKSFVWFIGMIDQDLAALAEADEKARKYRIGKIERMANQWRNRLATIGRTTVHSVAANAKQALNQALTL